MSVETTGISRQPAGNIAFRRPVPGKNSIGVFQLHCAAQQNLRREAAARECHEILEKKLLFAGFVVVMLRGDMGGGCAEARR